MIPLTINLDKVGVGPRLRPASFNRTCLMQLHRLRVRESGIGFAKDRLIVDRRAIAGSYFVSLQRLNTGVSYSYNC